MSATTTVETLPVSGAGGGNGGGFSGYRNNAPSNTAAQAPQQVCKV